MQHAVHVSQAYWATGPGLGGCKWPTCQKINYPPEAPLLFNVQIDPSEGIPLANANSTVDPGPTDGLPVPQAEIDAALAKVSDSRHGLSVSCLPSLQGKISFAGPILAADPVCPSVASVCE